MSTRENGILDQIKIIESKVSTKRATKAIKTLFLDGMITARIGFTINELLIVGIRVLAEHHIALQHPQKGYKGQIPQSSIIQG